MAQEQASVVISAKDDATAVLNRINGQFQNFGDRIKQIAAGFSIGYVSKQFIETADAMTLVNARLKLVTDSTEEFNEARSEAYRIAQANNIGLQEAATLYTRLADPVKRLGGTTQEVSGIVDAFATSLRVGGASTQEASAATLQFAQAMASGKLSGDEFRSIAEASPRFMRALADGMGVPIERLKELSKEGKLTADVVGNALLKSLAGLKDEAAGLPDTVGGAMQRVKNDAMLFVEEINNATNATGQMAEIVTSVSAVVGEFSNAVRVSSAELDASGRQFDLAAMAISAVGTVLETLVVLFANVGYVAKTIATEISVVYQQAKLVMQGQFEEARKVGEAWSKQADENRKAIDKFSDGVVGATSRVLQQREALKNHSITAKENSNEIARLAARSGAASGEFKKLESTIKATTDSQKASKKAAEEYEKAAKVVLELTSKSLGVNADYIEKLKALELWYSKNRDKTEQYVQAVTQLINQQPSVVAGHKAQTDELKRQEEQQKKTTEAADKARESAEELVQKYEDELAAMKLTGAERELQVALLALEKTGVDKTTAAYVEYEARIREAVGSIEAQKASKVAAETSATEWTKAASSIEQALTDALVQGFGNGKSIVKSIGDWIVNYFKSTIAKGIAQALTGAIMSGLSGIASAAGIGGSGGLGGLLGGSGGGFDLGSLASLFGGGSSFLAGLGSSLTGASSFASFTGLLGNGSFGAALGVAAPYLAAAGGLYALISGIGTGRDRSPAGQTYGMLSGTGGAADNIWAPFLQNPTGGDAYNSALQSVIASAQDIVGALGGSLSNALNLGLFSSVSPDGLGGQVAAIIKAGGQTLYDYNVNGPNETVEQRLAEQIPRFLLASLQEADLPAEFAAIFDELNLQTATAEQIAQAIAKAGELKSAQEREADQAVIDTADATQENTIILRDNSAILDRIAAILDRLEQVAGTGLTETANAARSAGDLVAGAVLALADRPINVSVEMPEVNGGV